MLERKRKGLENHESKPTLHEESLQESSTNLMARHITMDPNLSSMVIQALLLWEVCHQSIDKKNYQKVNKWSHAIKEETYLIHMIMQLMILAKGIMWS